MRLRLSLFKCPPGQQRCHAYRPLSTVFAFEPAYLALQKLHDQVELLLKEGGSVDYGTFHALTTAFADGLFRLLEGGSLEQSYLSSRISSPSRGETLGPLLGGMNANFELRHRIPQFVNQHQDMQKVLKLWSYYAEDVLFTLRTTDFSDHWNKIFENGVLEELIITDLRLVGALISSSLTYEKETGSLPERERHLLNRSVPKLLRSYSHLTRAFSPAYPKLRSLRYRSDIFENRAYLAKLLEALEM